MTCAIQHLRKDSSTLIFYRESFGVEYYDETNEKLPKFTISLEDDLAVLQASESNESRYENFEVNLKMSSRSNWHC